MKKNIKVYSKNNFRIFVVENSEIINSFLKKHLPNYLNSLVYANIINSFPVLNYLFSDEDIKVVYKLKTDGIINNAIVEVKNEIFRALINNNIKLSEVAPNLNQIDFQKVIGENGFLIVTKSFKNNSYSSQIKLEAKTLVENINQFLLQSEQIYSAIVSVLNFDEKNHLNVKRAELILFQKTPLAKEKDVLFFEEFITENSLEQMSLKNYIELLDPKFLEEKKIALGCFCSKEKMLKVVKSLPKKEIENIFKKSSEIEIICQFCKTKYKYKSKDLF